MKQGWETKKLGDVCEINYGTRVVQKKDGGTIYPVYGGGGATFKMDRYNREDCVVVARFAMSNQCVRYVQGKFFLNDSGLSVRTKEEKLSQEYLDKCIFSLNDKIYSLGKGVAQKNLDMKEFRHLDINYPCSKDEQSRIVEELDQLSNIIEKKRQQLSELDNLAQSIFYDMFGDPITNEKGWEVKKLGEIYEINPSKRKTLVGVKGDDIVSFLPMEDLSIKACYVTPKQNRKCDEVMSSYTCFADNDVLMAKVTPCFENGKVGIACNLINGVGFGSSEFIVIRPKGLAVREYVYHLVQTDNFVEKACRQFTGTSGLRRVPKQFVEQLQIGFPPLSPQQLFAQKIEAIEKEKELIKQSIKETEELFNSRMDYYFG